MIFNYLVIASRRGAPPLPTGTGAPGGQRAWCRRAWWPVATPRPRGFVGARPGRDTPIASPAGDTLPGRGAYAVIDVKTLAASSVFEGYGPYDERTSTRRRT